MLRRYAGAVGRRATVHVDNGCQAIGKAYGSLPCVVGGHCGRVRRIRHWRSGRAAA